MRSAVGKQDIVSTDTKTICTAQKPQVFMQQLSSPREKKLCQRAQKRNIVTAHSHPVSAADNAPHGADSRAPWASPDSPSRPRDPPSPSTRPVDGSWRHRQPNSASRCFARRRFGRGSGVFPLRCRIRRLLPRWFFFCGLWGLEWCGWMDG